MYTNERGNDGDTAVTVDVFLAVSDALGTDPLSLPPLGDSIDPDVLEGLVDSPGGQENRIEFEYASHVVTVRGDGSVSVSDESARSPSETTPAESPDRRPDDATGIQRTESAGDGPFTPGQERGTDGVDD